MNTTDFANASFISEPVIAFGLQDIESRGIGPNLFVNLLAAADACVRIVDKSDAPSDIICSFDDFFNLCKVHGHLEFIEKHYQTFYHPITQLLADIPVFCEALVTMVQDGTYFKLKERSPMHTNIVKQLDELIDLVPTDFRWELELVSMKYHQQLIQRPITQSMLMENSAHKKQ